MTTKAQRNERIRGLLDALEDKGESVAEAITHAYEAYNPAVLAEVKRDPRDATKNLVIGGLDGIKSDLEVMLSIVSVIYEFSKMPTED